MTTCVSIIRDRAVLAVCLTLCFALSGCGSKPAWEVTHPVKGLLKFKGKPVANADLAFFPQDSSYPDTVRPRARTKEDGTFVVWTYNEGDGAPVGNYKVTAVRNEVGISKEAVVAKPNDLPPKYSTLDGTDLQITVKEGENQLPEFTLK